MDALLLHDSVIAAIPAPDGVAEVHGFIIGRTIEERPRYDVRLDDGRHVTGLTAEWLRLECAA